MTMEAPRLSTAADPDLILLARSSDRAAIEELYRRHSPSALRFARSLTDGVTADDLVAEAFARILEVMRDGGGPTVSFRAYLLTAVRNAYAAHVRRDARMVWTAETGDLDAPLPAGPDDAEARMERRLVESAFSSLPERWQAVLWHTTVERDDQATVGRLLGIKPNAVSALAYRARDGLRDAYLAAHLREAQDEECRQTHPLLPAYARGRLSGARRLRVEEHLDGCRDCSAAVAELTALSTRLGALLGPAVLGVAGAAYVVPQGASPVPVPGEAISWIGRVGLRVAGPRAAGWQGLSASMTALAATLGVVVAAGAATLVAGSLSDDPTADRAGSEGATPAASWAPPSGSPSAPVPSTVPPPGTPGAEPTRSPVLWTGSTPTALPTGGSTVPEPSPTAGPTTGPTRRPSPTPKPTPKPTPEPTPTPTVWPTASPQPSSTASPSTSPTSSPTSSPTVIPTGTTVDVALTDRSLQWLGTVPDGAHWRLTTTVVADTLPSVHVGLLLPGLMSADPVSHPQACSVAAGRIDCDIAPAVFVLEFVMAPGSTVGTVTASAAGNVDPEPANNTAPLPLVP